MSGSTVLRSEGSATLGGFEAEAEALDGDAARELQRHRALLAHMQHGYLRCRMIWEGARPIDFIVEDTNPAFDRLTGLRGRDMRGRRITETLPAIREDPFDWIARFGSVVATGQPERLQRFAAPVGRFYDLDIFSPEPGCFAVIFDEVTDQQRADEARRMAASELQAVFDAVPALMLITRDREARHIEGNRAARELLRSPPEANLSHSAPDPAARPRHFRVRCDGIEPAPDELPVQIAAAHGIELRDVTMELAFDDGTTRRLFGNVTPLRDAHARPAGAVAAFLDVTERQHAADRIALLARVNERLAVAVTPVEVVEAVLHDGLTLLGAETAVVRLAGPEGDLTTLYSTGVPPEVVAATRVVRLEDRSPVADAVRTGMPVWLGTTEEILARYPHLERYFADVRSGAWAALPLLLDGRGIGSIGLTFPSPQAFSDEDRNFILVLANNCARALERTILSEESRRQRAILDSIFEVDPGGIAIIADRPGDEPRFVMANPAYRAMSPQPDLDPVGRTVEEVWPATENGPGSTSDSVRRQMVAGSATGRYHAGSGPGTRHYIWNTRTIPWMDGRAIVVLLWDVTKLHELQEQREDMLRMISHDLRSPLNALVLHAGMLQRTFDSSDTRAGRAAKIIANAMRMERMIRDLVEMTLLEGGQMSLSAAPVDFGTYARQVVERLDDGERIRVEIPGGLAAVSLDADRFERVLVNLLDNALKYSPPSETVMLSAAPALGGITVDVIDRGPGIARDDLPRIFDRFFRTKDAHRKEGLGLGLYITSLLVRAHGGRVEAESVPGQGSTFRVFLPAA